MITKLWKLRTLRQKSAGNRENRIHGNHGPSGTDPAPAYVLNAPNVPKGTHITGNGREKGPNSDNV